MEPRSVSLHSKWRKWEQDRIEKPARWSPVGITRLVEWWVFCAILTQIVDSVSDSSICFEIDLHIIPFNLIYINKFLIGVIHLSKCPPKLLDLQHGDVPRSPSYGVYIRNFFILQEYVLMLMTSTMETKFWLLSYYLKQKRNVRFSWYCIFRSC